MIWVPGGVPRAFGPPWWLGGVFGFLLGGWGGLLSAGRLMLGCLPLSGCRLGRGGVCGGVGEVVGLGFGQALYVC